jgi:NADH:ubiquinone oxidoreductase subunit F (NADH-binding)
MRGRELLERIDKRQGTAADLALITDLGDTMKATSLCAHGGRGPYPVLTAIEHFGDEFQQRLQAKSGHI